MATVVFIEPNISEEENQRYLEEVRSVINEIVATLSDKQIKALNSEN